MLKEQKIHSSSFLCGNHKVSECGEIWIELSLPSAPLKASTEWQVSVITVIFHLQKKKKTQHFMTAHKLFSRRQTSLGVFSRHPLPSLLPAHTNITQQHTFVTGLSPWKHFSHYILCWLHGVLSQPWLQLLLVFSTVINDLTLLAGLSTSSEQH